MITKVYEVHKSTNDIKCMKNFNGYVLFGKLFHEPSENVTLPKKHNVCMTLMKRVQYALMLAYKLRIGRSRVRVALVAPSCVLGQDRCLAQSVDFNIGSGGSVPT